MIEASALVSALYCAKNGVTFVIDHHASPFAIENSLETIANAFDRVGISHLLCYEISDRDGDGPKEKGLQETDSPVYSHFLRWQNTAQLKNFFTAELKDKTAGFNDFLDRYVSKLPSNFLSLDPLNRAQYTEINIFLSNYLLSSQGDRMAMANSVEGRYPFLDHRVVEFAFSVPPKYRLNGLTEKFLLKQAARNVIPQELVDRPKKPYRAPISSCFYGDKPIDYVEELLSESAIRQAGYFDPVKVTRLANKCRTQKGNLLSERENMALVGILSTQLMDHHFIKNFPAYPIQEPQDVKIFTG